jgi:hypothetical protein
MSINFAPKCPCAKMTPAPKCPSRQIVADPQIPQPLSGSPALEEFLQKGRRGCKRNEQATMRFKNFAVVAAAFGAFAHACKTLTIEGADKLFDQEGIVDFAIANNGNKIITVTRDFKAWVWKEVAGKFRSTQLIPGNGNLLRATCVVGSQSANCVAVGYTNGAVRIFDLETKEFLFENWVHTDPVFHLDFSDEGTRTISAINDGWDVNFWTVSSYSHAVINFLLADAPHRKIRSVSISGTGSHFAYATSAGTFAAMPHLKKYKVTVFKTDIKSTVSKTMLSEGGEIFVVGYDTGNLEMWTIDYSETTANRTKLPVHKSKIVGLMITPRKEVSDNMKITSFSEKGGVNVCNIDGTLSSSKADQQSSTTIFKVLTTSNMKQVFFIVARNMNCIYRLKPRVDGGAHFINDRQVVPLPPA